MARDASPKRSPPGGAAVPADDPNKSPRPFDVRIIKTLVGLMNQYDLSENDLHEGEHRIRLRRGTQKEGVQTGAAPAAPAGPAPATHASPPAATPDKPAKGGQEADAVFALVQVDLAQVVLVH